MIVIRCDDRMRHKECARGRVAAGFPGSSRPCNGSAGSICARMFWRLRYDEAEQILPTIDSCCRRSSDDRSNGSRDDHSGSTTDFGPV